MVALQDNLETVRHFTALPHRESLAPHAAAKHQHTQWTTRQPDLTQKRERRATLGSLKRFNKTIEVRVARMATMRLWQVVVLVTCVEAYLQDVLSAAARVGPTLMAKSDQQASYADTLAATTPEDLATDLRARWARWWLERHSGPAGVLQTVVRQETPNETGIEYWIRTVPVSRLVPHTMTRTCDGFSPLADIGGDTSLDIAINLDVLPGRFQTTHVPTSAPAILRRIPDPATRVHDPVEDAMLVAVD
ncbi:MAG TPA: hypothetical protein VNC82_17245 [Candidatus Limnocylindria bacterium]|nr:hypothetical protein [Candidatus Limnocylindria bacterium]